MTIAQMREKGKLLIARVPSDVLVVAILVLSSVASFGLGVLAARGEGNGDEVLRIEEVPMTAGASIPSSQAAAAGSAMESAMPSGGQYVASRNGTKYHLPWCAGAKSISEQNKIWFASKEDAEAAGYTPPANCKGI